MLHRSLYFWLCAFCLLPFHELAAHGTDSLVLVLDEVEAMGSARVTQVNSGSFYQEQNSAFFKSMGLDNLSEAVKRFSGVDVHDYGGVGGLKTVSVRGMGGKHTAVSYDGVPVSGSQSGAVDIGRFSLDNVEMLSLTVGQSDDIFLSAREYASAGLLALFSKRPQRNASYIGLKTGSFGLANLLLHHDNRISSGWAFSLHGNLMRSDGSYPFTLVNGNISSHEKRRDSDIRQIDFEGNLFGNMGGGDMSVKLCYHDSERGLPGAVNLYNKENRERLWNNNFFVQSKYEKPISAKLRIKTALKFDYNFSRYKEVNRNYSSGVQVDLNEQNEFYVSLAALYTPLPKFSFSFATDVSRAALENNFNNGVSPERLSLQSAVAARYASKVFSATASLLATSVSDNVSASNGTEYRRLSPSLNLSFTPFSEVPLHIRVSMKDSYRIPTFADLYFQRLGNVGLKPEKASLYNIGFAWSSAVEGFCEYMAITADAYYNKVKDKIVALPTMYVWRMMNFGEAEILGTDINTAVDFRLEPRVKLSLNACYSFMHAVDVTSSSAKNYRDQLPYTPRHSGNFSLILDNPLLQFSYMLTAVGERYMLPQNSERNRMPGYLEHSFSFSKTLELNNAALFLQCQFLNVGNCRYEVIRYYPMPGYSWRLSARLSF